LSPLTPELQRCGRIAVAAAAASLALPVYAAEALAVRAEGQGGKVVVEARATVNASLPVVWSTITDYDHLSQFIPNLSRSQVVERHGTAVLIEQRGEVKVLFVRFPVHATIAADEHYPDSIDARSINGNFKLTDAGYRIQRLDDGQRVLLSWNGTLQPVLWTPMFITTPLVRDVIEDQFRAMVNEIERRQQRISGRAAAGGAGAGGTGADGAGPADSPLPVAASLLSCPAADAAHCTGPPVLPDGTAQVDHDHHIREERADAQRRDVPRQLVELVRDIDRAGHGSQPLRPGTVVPQPVRLGEPHHRIGDRSGGDHDQRRVGDVFGDAHDQARQPGDRVKVQMAQQPGGGFANIPMKEPQCLDAREQDDDGLQGLECGDELHRCWREYRIISVLALTIAGLLQNENLLPSDRSQPNAEEARTA